MFDVCGGDVFVVVGGVVVVCRILLSIFVACRFEVGLHWLASVGVVAIVVVVVVVGVGVAVRVASVLVVSGCFVVVVRVERIVVNVVVAVDASLLLFMLCLVLTVPVYHLLLSLPTLFVCILFSLLLLL